MQGERVILRSLSHTHSLFTLPLCDSCKAC